MRKKFKTKKRFNIKIILIPLILILMMILLNFISNNLRLSMSNEIIIQNIFKTNNNYSYVGKENTNFIKKAYNYLKSNLFNSPVNMLKSELKYTGNEKEVISFMYGEAATPSIYIYNSHQGETYSMKYLEDYNIIPDVLMASYMLKDKLKDIGINAIVEESDILAYMKENNLNHADSYKASRYFLNKAINNYSNIELFIDLHRDAASHNSTTININGKPCAKVLFVIGLENSNYENNLSVVNKINNILLEKYPSLTRGIMKKEGYGVNGIYNQDLAPNVILIEIGGHENNIEEINNTLNIMAEVIGEYLNEEK